jgi:GNAT superfamily N-acetyltransferase
MTSILIKERPALSHSELNSLFLATWPNHRETDFQPVFSRSLTYIAAYARVRLVGFVNVAWDGGIHAFIVDTTVHPDFQRRGIGVKLVQTAASSARKQGIHWLHVDYEPHLERFYMECGFKPTLAGLMRLNGE